MKLLVIFSDKYNGRLPYKEEIDLIGAERLVESCLGKQTQENQCQIPLQNEFDFSYVQNYSPFGIAL